MNHKRTSNLFSPKGIGQQIPKLALGVAALSILALAACAPVGGFVAVPAAPADGVASTTASSNEAVSEWVFLATNPELMLARGYVPAGGWTQRMPQHLKLQNNVDPDSDIGLLEFFKPQTTQEVNTPDSRRSKVDPDSDIGLLEFFKPQTTQEVNTPNSRRNKVDPNGDIGLLEFFRPETTQEVNTSDPLSDSLALNPELSVARRYAAPLEVGDAPASLPLRRWTCFGQRTPGSDGRHQSDSMALNPELSVAHRYAAPLEARDDRNSLSLPHRWTAWKGGAGSEARDAFDFQSLPLRQWPCLSQGGH